MSKLYDVYGELLGLLGAHPVAPLVSIHHVDVVWPIYPGMSRVKALQHLLQSVKLDSASIMQQSIYYDRQRMVLVHFESLKRLQGDFFFFNWYKNDHYIAYAFTTRPVARQPYERPFAFYTNVVSFHQDTNHNQTVGIRSPRKSPHPHVLRDCCRVLSSRNRTTMSIEVNSRIGAKNSEITELQNQQNS
ncbi:glycosyltransferase [Citrus sinensis]|nr:glycosyltransferase [Citrus sinensis]